MNISKYISSEVVKFIPSIINKHIKTSRTYIKNKSDVENIYHCCTHKSASQWMKSILSDTRITYRYSGLESFTYFSEWMDGPDPRPMEERYFHNRPFPINTIATPVYLGYECFQSIPKPSAWRAFFVLRDPRDTVVSFYFYHKHGNHVPSKKGDRIEKKLNEMSITDGLRFIIDYLDTFSIDDSGNFGLFDVQRSWINAEHPNISVFRYEDLTGPDQLDYVLQLFKHCEIPIPKSEVVALLEKHSFERKAGRDRGVADPSSHYRKGKAGDWRQHFDEKVRRHFSEVTGDLTNKLGYS